MIGTGDEKLGIADPFRPLSTDLQSRIQVIYPPLQLDHFIKKHHCDRVLECLQPRHDKPTLLFIGRLDHQKLPGLFLKVAKNILKTKVVIAGGGPLAMSLRRETTVNPEFMELSRRLEWKGSLDQKTIPDVLTSASKSVFLMTSSHEGVPIVALEALGMGTPLVTCQCGGIEEIIRDPVWNSVPKIVYLTGPSGRRFAIERYDHASLIMVDCQSLFGTPDRMVYEDIVFLMVSEVKKRFEKLEQEAAREPSSTIAQNQRWIRSASFRQKYGSDSFKEKWRQTIDNLLMY